MRAIIKMAVLTKEQTAEIGQRIFAKLGTVPNLYTTIGCSNNALSGFLIFSGILIKEFYEGKNKEVDKESFIE